MIPGDVNVIGAGPSGLMAAEVLAKGGAGVTIHDHMAAPARKFLLAGRGGLNLTHSEPLDQFLERYGEARGFLDPRSAPFRRMRLWRGRTGSAFKLSSAHRAGCFQNR